MFKMDRLKKKIFTRPRPHHLLRRILDSSQVASPLTLRCCRPPPTKVAVVEAVMELGALAAQAAQEPIWAVVAVASLVLRTRA